MSNEETRFMEDMGQAADQEYQLAVESALDICLECDLFSWNESEHGHAVECRMRENPLQCGGPYHRVPS